MLVQEQIRIGFGRKQILKWGSDSFIVWRCDGICRCSYSLALWTSLSKLSLAEISSECVGGWLSKAIFVGARELAEVPEPPV